MLLAQARHFFAVAMQHQGVVAKGPLVEPGGEQDRGDQPDTGNQPERQRQNDADDEHQYRHHSIDRAAGVGAAAAHFEIAIADLGDLFEHDGQGHHRHQQGGGHVDHRQEEHTQRDLDQHQHCRRADIGAFESRRHPIPVADPVHHAGDHRVPQHDAEDQPHHHRQQGGPHQMPQHTALGETFHCAGVCEKYVLHTCLSFENTGAIVAPSLNP